MGKIVITGDRYFLPLPKRNMFRYRVSTSRTIAKNYDCAATRALCFALLCFAVVRA